MMSHHEQLLPGVLVRVTQPDPEHRTYLDDQGRIVDVREFGDHRYCQIELQRSKDLIFFASTELEIISVGNCDDENLTLNNICRPRSSGALAMLCEISGCEQFACYDCYPAVAPGVTSLQVTIALCEQHAREADPALQREVQS